MSRLNSTQKIRQDGSLSTIQRRKTAALSALGIVDFSIISLYQLGYIRNLPDLPGKIFNADKVNASDEALMTGIPDGVISLAYIQPILLWLLPVFGWVKKEVYLFTRSLLGAATLDQATAAVHYLFNMVSVQKKVCLYCVTEAIINFATLKPVWALLKK